MDVYNKWLTTQDKAHFQALYSSMKPLIYDAARKASYGSNLPESAHRIWAAQSFFDALRTYKPESGATLQTHVYGAVHQKAKRLNYMYQSLAYKPEPRAMQVGVFQNEHANMREALGRDPTNAELASKLDWGIKDVERIRKEVHSELSLADGVEEQGFNETPETEAILHHIYDELSLEEKQVYDCVLGKNGKARMMKANNKVDFERISRTVGYSTSKVRQVFARIRTKLEKAAQR
jgi:DNA-directed RNA polymerase specialized sigma subunit